MPTALEGFPAEITAELGEGAVSLALDEAVYPAEAVYAAAYVFIDRAYVLIDRPQAARWRVTLAAKRPGADAAALRGLAGDLLNELLGAAWRHQITVQNRAAIEAVTMQAVAGAMGPPSLDELAKFDFTEEPFDDPLGIAVAWEEKYQKKPGGGEGGEKP